MIEKLVLTPGSSRNGGLRLQQAVREADHRLSPFFTVLHLRVKKQPLKAGHQLIGLCHRILIRAETVLIRGFKDMEALRAAGSHNIIREFQIPLLRLAQIQPHHRLQNGAGIDPQPVAGDQGDLLLSLSFSDPADHIVQMPPRRLQDLLPEGFVRTDLIKMYQSQEHIFAAPQVPAGEFLLPAVGGDPAVRFLKGKKLPDRFCQNVIKLLIPGILPGHAGSPHELPPVFAAPAMIGVIRPAAARAVRQSAAAGILRRSTVRASRRPCELLCRKLPQASVLQLLFFHKTKHFVRDSLINCFHFFPSLPFCFPFRGVSRSLLRAPGSPDLLHRPPPHRGPLSAALPAVFTAPLDCLPRKETQPRSQPGSLPRLQNP